MSAWGVRSSLLSQLIGQEVSHGHTLLQGRQGNVVFIWVLSLWRGGDSEDGPLSETKPHGMWVWGLGMKEAWERRKLAERERERGQGVRRAWQDPRLLFPLPEVGATTPKIRFHDLIHIASN